MISFNAKIYNGEQDSLSVLAKKMMEQLRCEIKKHINTCGDKTFFKKEETKSNINNESMLIKIPGKLTAPPASSMRNSMDAFMKQQEDTNAQVNMCRQRAVVEESKTKEKIKRNGHRHKDLSADLSQSESEYDFVTPKVSNGGDQQNDRKQRRILRNQ